METMKQLQMFTEGQDTPLFSQTPQRSKVIAFKPQIKQRQISLLLNVHCPACLDTGNLGGKRCICQRGK
jgi:hypothetical protein